MNTSSLPETLGAIARKQHVSLNALLEANPGVDARKLRIGQKLQIPTAPIAVAVAASAESPGGDAPAYVAKTGDPLNKPAKIRGPSSVELMAMNDLQNPDPPRGPETQDFLSIILPEIWTQAKSL